MRDGFYWVQVACAVFVFAIALVIVAIALAIVKTGFRQPIAYHQMANIPDLINGGFELCGSGAIALSIRKLWKEKKVHGYHWATLLFFTTWGFWNLFYYPHLRQWWSFSGGIATASANALYLGLILWYSRGSR